MFTLHSPDSVVVPPGDAGSVVWPLATLPHSHYKFPSKWNKNDPIIIHYLETIKSALSAGGRGLIRYLDCLANVIEWMLMSSLVVTVFVCWKFPYYMH